MLCPICNGFEQLSAACPSCSVQAVDYGPIVDFTGPYAPYQTKADAEKTNSMETMNSDLYSELSCNHVIYCPNCDRTYAAIIAKWP